MPKKTRSTTLRKEIIVVIVLKLAVLFLLWELFFSKNISVDLMRHFIQ